MSLLRRVRDWVLYLQDVIRTSDGEYKFFLVLLCVGLTSFVQPMLGATWQAYKLHSDRLSLVLLYVAVALSVLAVTSVVFIAVALLRRGETVQKN